MKTNVLQLSFLFFFIGWVGFAQTARIKGIILDENNHPVEEVNVTAQDKSTKTNANGFYQLTIPANQKIQIVFTHTSLKKNSVSVELKPNEDYEFNFYMNDKAEGLGEVIVIANNRKRVQGITNITPAVIRKIPGANAGVENILKSLPGVSSNNELSTQYAVRVEIMMRI